MTKFFLVQGWVGIIYGEYWLTEERVRQFGDARQFEILKELDVPDSWSPLLVQAAIEHAEIEFYGGVR